MFADMLFLLCVWAILEFALTNLLIGCLEFLFGIWMPTFCVVDFVVCVCARACVFFDFLLVWKLCMFCVALPKLNLRLRPVEFDPCGHPTPLGSRFVCCH